MTACSLSDIIIYPVKSLAGISVQRWSVSPTGLLYDRKWMLIDNEGHFLSQRRLPRMALIKTALTTQHLILSADNRADLVLPLQVSGNNPRIDSVIWHDKAQALHVCAMADAWLSDFLQQDCRLVYQAENDIRAVDAIYSQPSDQVAFSDGFPFLIVSENSLAALNAEMGLSLEMARFRPNLVISGCEAYSEDYWREIRIGRIDFRLPKPCSRCSVPAIDSNTAEVGKEPLTTLSRLRKWQNKVYFGQNALHNQSGVLSVGDSLTVKVSGKQQPPLA